MNKPRQNNEKHTAKVLASNSCSKIPREVSKAENRAGNTTSESRPQASADNGM